MIPERICVMIFAPQVWQIQSLLNVANRPINSMVFDEANIVCAPCPAGTVFTPAADPSAAEGT